MKFFTKSVIGLVLAVVLLFTCLCYASFTSYMELSGTLHAEAKEPDGIYISKVEIHSQTDVSNATSNVVLPTNLHTDMQVNARYASITYRVTVHNKTDMTYWYLGMEYLQDVESNNLINTSAGITVSTKDNASSNSTQFDTSDWIPPQTERIFYVTFNFGSKAQGDISTLINFRFGLHMGSVSDEFLKVLNDKNSTYGYNYLASAFDTQYKESGSTVIGNVGTDQTIFNNLFGSSLTINVDGKEMPVTILIERKDVDGNKNTGDAYTGNTSLSGCEYTLYVTVDDLSSPGGKATVYAISYTCGADGTWYTIGELYEGQCTIRDYDTTDNVYQGAFDADNWVATKKDYVVTDDISYRVGYEQGTQYDKLTTIEDLMSVKDQEFYNKVNNNSGKLLKPVCKVLYTYIHHNGQYTENENIDNQYKQGYAALKTAFDKIKPYCLIANGAQEVKIQNASSLTRAELIQMLEEIQSAYDYYCSVNPNG